MSQDGEYRHHCTLAPEQCIDERVINLYQTMPTFHTPLTRSTRRGESETVRSGGPGPRQ